MATLIRIGNSRGVRIPKAIIEQADLEDKELSLKVMKEGLLIQPVRKPRHGWRKEFDKALLAEEVDQSDHEWLDAPLTDEEDWEW